MLTAVSSGRIGSAPYEFKYLDISNNKKIIR